MSAFVGKWQVIAIVLMVLGSVSLKAQEAAPNTSIQEYVITKNDDRTSLFQIINSLKQLYGITTQFKAFELGKNGLTKLELEFSPVNGTVTTLLANNTAGIEPQVIQVDKNTQELIFVGKGTMSGTSLQPKMVSMAGKPDQDIAVATGEPGKRSSETKEAVKEDQSETYSIRSPKVTDPSKLKDSQIDMTGPKELPQPSKAKPETVKVEAVKTPTALAKVPVVKEEEVKTTVAVINQNEEKPKLALKKETVEEAIKRQAVTAESNGEELKGKTLLTDAQLEERRKAAAAQDDEVSMKQTIEELKRLQEKERRKVKRSEALTQGYVFINAQQFNYETYPKRTLIYDSQERTVLVLPTAIDEAKAVRGTTTINGLRFQFSYQDNILKLTNGANEVVDLQGKPIK